jgi:GT2 family glycosyltransferase
MRSTAILILNWNNQNFLEKFIPSLVEFTPPDLAEIIVADNGSTDGSVAWLKKHLPKIRIIELDKNYGFAGGYNLAIEQCEHEIIVLLNSDIQVSENWLPPLIERLADQKTAAVMPKILSFSTKNQFEYAGAAGGYIDKFGYPFCRGRIFDSIETDTGQYDEAQLVHWTTGACMAIKKQVFADAGAFDSDFFAHMEEIDLCWRIRRMGFELWVEPKSYVYHVGGGTLPNESPGKLYLNFRNNLALLFKNLPPSRRFWIIVLRLLLDGLAAAQYLFSGRLKYIFSIIKAHWHFFAWIKKLRETSAKVNLPYLKNYAYPESIVFSFFLKKKKNYSNLDYRNGNNFSN